MQKKVRNWKEYNKSLKQRGSMIFTLSKDFLNKIYYKGEQSRGGVREYSNTMYEFLLTIKYALRLPWRATIGFAEGLLRKAFPGKRIRVPDYAHASRVANQLSLKINTNIKPKQGMELVFDSTGVSVYSTSGYHIRKHGKDMKCRTRDQWKKIHVAMDINTMQIVAIEYTGSNINDCQVVDKMSKSIKGKVNSVRADGAYDTHAFYRIIEDKWHAKAIIPPSVDSKSQDKLKRKVKRKPYLKQRDQTIKFIRRHKTFATGLKKWKIASGYHKRSLIEACMSRIKKIFGFHLQSKTSQGRINEIITKMNLLNKMASFGRAQYF